MDFGSEEVSFADCLGRILNEDLVADRPFPPFDRISMDGIAIAFQQFENGQRSFPIESIAPAGAPQVKMNAADHCVEAMTGAVLPAGCDTVIRYEDLEIENGIAKIVIDQITGGQNVHQKGLDRKQGEVNVGKGKEITPAVLGIAATIGKSALQVVRNPKVVIIATGDELVEIEDLPEAHQIRKSNVHTIAATMMGWSIPSTLVHLNDEKEVIYNTLQHCLDHFDVLILSGGVSKGKFDFIPGILDELGVKKLFHRVAQRPGKPFWFGACNQKNVVFALPGNPVSSFMCAHRFVRKWLDVSFFGKVRTPLQAKLSTDFSFKPDLTYFLQVKTEIDAEGTNWAVPYEGHGSGDLANLVDSNAFLELPKGRDHFKRGEVFPILQF